MVFDRLKMWWWNRRYRFVSKKLRETDTSIKYLANLLAPTGLRSQDVERAEAGGSLYWHHVECPAFTDIGLALCEADLKSLIRRKQKLVRRLATLTMPQPDKEMSCSGS